MKFVCRDCGVIHAAIKKECGACGFTDEDAPGNEHWCKRRKV